MKEQRQSSPAISGEVIDSRNHPIVAYDPGAGRRFVIIQVEDLQDLLSSTAGIVVNEVKQGHWSEQMRRYRTSAPVEFASVLFEKAPGITLWESWEREAQLSFKSWSDEPTDALPGPEACIQQLNKTIKSYLYSPSPKDGLIQLSNLQTDLCYVIDHAACCVGLLTETIANGMRTLALPKGNWVYTAIELSQEGKQDESLDVIFDNIDEMLLQGKFKECDSVLETMPVNQLSNAQLITVLTATLAAKKELQSRGDFFRRVRSVLEARDSDANPLLQGLG